MPLVFHIESESSDDDSASEISPTPAAVTTSKLPSNDKINYSSSPASKKKKKKVKKLRSPHSSEGSKNMKNSEHYEDPKEKFRNLMQYIDHERSINNPYIKIREDSS
jgi:hypothetical protein